MASGFGFSAGDCVSALNLVVKVSKALHDAKGASAEYQHVKIDLENLRRTLVHLQSASPRADDVEHLEQAKLLAFSCMIPLQSFLDDVQKYRSSLDRNRTARPFIVASRKVQWTVFEEEKLTKLRNAISAQILHLVLRLGVNTR